MSIRVKNTKIQDNLLVTEGELILVDITEQEAVSAYPHCINLPGNETSKKPIIVSTEEPINGDTVLVDARAWGGFYEIWIYKKAPCPLPYWGNPNGCRKVIVTPEQFSNTDKVNIISGVLKEGKVLVQCEVVEAIPEGCLKGCLETKGFIGTPHEGVNVCEDGCVLADRYKAIKQDNGHALLYKASLKYTAESIIAEMGWEWKDTESSAKSVARFAAYKLNSLKDSL